MTHMTRRENGRRGLLIFLGLSAVGWILVCTACARTSLQVPLDLSGPALQDSDPRVAKNKSIDAILIKETTISMPTEEWNGGWMRIKDALRGMSFIVLAESFEAGRLLAMSQKMKERFPVRAHSPSGTAISSPNIDTDAYIFLIQRKGDGLTCSVLKTNKDSSNRTARRLLNAFIHRLKKR